MPSKSGLVAICRATARVQLLLCRRFAEAWYRRERRREDVETTTTEKKVHESHHGSMFHRRHMLAKLHYRQRDFEPEIEWAGNSCGRSFNGRKNNSSDRLLGLKAMRS